MSKTPARTAVKALSRKPILSRAPTTFPRNTEQANPAAPRSEPTFDENSTYRRSRSIIYAVGVGIIAGAGAILGAQWKTYEQEKEKAALFTEANANVDGNATQGESSTLSPEAIKGSNPGSSPQPAPNAVQNSNARLIRAQIQALEDTKARLQTQKTKLEMKIRNLHERKARREEMEAARKGFGQQQSSAENIEAKK